MFVITSNMPGFMPECEDLPAASDFEDAVDLLVDEMNRHVDDLAEDDEALTLRSSRTLSF